MSMFYIGENLNYSPVLTFYHTEQWQEFLCEILVHRVDHIQCSVCSISAIVYWCLCKIDKCTCINSSMTPLFKMASRYPRKIKILLTFFLRQTEQRCIFFCFHVFKIFFVLTPRWIFPFGFYFRKLFFITNHMSYESLFEMHELRYLQVRDMERIL